MRPPFLQLTTYLFLTSSLLIPSNLLANFSDITVESGLDHLQSESKSSKHAGATAVDVNGDGYTDCLLYTSDAADE